MVPLYSDKFTLIVLIIFYILNYNIKLIYKPTGLKVLPFLVQFFLIKC